MPDDVIADQFAQPLTCPKCAGAMAPHAEAGVTFDRCVACGGLFFDLREHERLAGANVTAEAVDPAPVAPAVTSALAPGEVGGRALACPRCKGTMSRLRQGARHDVLVDYCPVCNGTFFDAGEFRRFAQEEDGAGSWLARLRGAVGL